MRTKRCSLAAGIAAASVCTTLPMAWAWAEIAGIPEIHESAVLEEMPMATTGAEILAGDPAGEYSGVESGVVYVLSSSDGTSWTETARFGPSAPIAGMRFGDHIFVEGSQALITAAPDYSGWEHYLFEETAPGVWLERARLVGEAGHVLRPFAAVNGETIVISGIEILPYSRGEVSIFEGDGSSWLLQQRLVSDEPGDCFGGPLALAEDVLVVGAGCAVVAGADTGAAYVYVKRATGDWELAQKLVPLPLGMDQAGYVNGGRSLAASDDLIVAGSPCDWALGPAESCAGAAYVYRRIAEDEWVQEAKLLPPFDGPTPPFGAQFGDSVALSDGLVYVCENQGRWETGETGSCWAFRDFGEGNWQPIARLIPGDPSANDDFASGIDVEAGTILIPGEGTDDNPPGVYVFLEQSLPLDLEVALDIKPGNRRNVINPRSKGRFWVAVLSDEGFDSLQVDSDTVAFGPGAASPDRYKVKDVNTDRIPDLMLRFRTSEVGLQCGDTELELRGETYAGDSIIGTDAIRTVGCKKPKKSKKK